MANIGAILGTLAYLAIGILVAIKWTTIRAEPKGWHYPLLIFMWPLLPVLVLWQLIVWMWQGSH